MNKTYDIAISFAGEDRAVALGIASELISEGVTVFYDEFEKSDLWGKNLYEHLISIYKDNSKYCLMLLSESYSKKLWTSHERKAAQARAFRENKEYILPLKLDNTEVPGTLETTGYLDYRSETDKTVAKLIIKKLWGDLENDRGLNILKIQFEELYMRMMLVCELSFMPSSHPNKSQRGLAPEMHHGALKMLSKLKSDLQINAPNIDSLILNQITHILNCIENILSRAEFLLNVENPDLAKYYFISEIPESDFHEIYDFLNKLKVFDGYAVRNMRHYKPEEILLNWRVAESETPRYCSDLKVCKYKKGLTPFVFNHTTLRNLHGSFIKSGCSVNVFKAES